MLELAEKIKLIKISLVILIILLAVTAFYVNSYVNDLEVIVEDKKIGRSLIEEKIDPKILGNLDVLPGYKLNIFANTFDQPIFLSPGPFNGILVADQGLEGFYQLVDNTEDDIADFNTRILNGFNEVSAIAFNNPLIYIADATGVYQYDYNALQAEASDREKIFALDAHDNKNIIDLVIYNQDIYIFLEDGFVYKGQAGSTFNLLTKSWPRCSPNLNILNYPCLPTDSDLASQLSDAIKIDIAVINSSLFSSDNQGDVLALLVFKDREAKIVKIDVVDGKLVSMSDFVTNWKKSDSEPSSVSFSSDGQLFIADKKNGSIYKVTKINN